jgi:hypothetical protein
MKTATLVALWLALGTSTVQAQDAAVPAQDAAVPAQDAAVPASETVATPPSPDAAPAPATPALTTASPAGPAADAASPAAPETTGTPPSAVTAAPPAGPASASPAAAPEPLEAPPPPVMVIALATGRVPVELVDAVRDALVAQVTPMAGGRPVLPLRDGLMLAAVAACADAPCVGAQVASGQAVGAVVARLSRTRTRGPVDVRIEMVDPVSGAPRTPPIALQVLDAASAGPALEPLVATLRAAMFSPPLPPPQVLISVNVDGATVRIDGEIIGESPVAQRRVRAGRHVILVQHPDYLAGRREIDVAAGDSERVDITLQSLVAAGIDPRSVGGADPAASEPAWFERWEVWAGVGGGVVLVSVIIGASVAASSSGAPPSPQGIPLPPIR